MAHATPLTAAQCRAADRIAHERFGMPTLLLMENAGRIVAEQTMRLMRRTRRAGRVVVVCGPGNNGGDGLVAARYLVNAGVHSVVVHSALLSAYSGDAAVNATIVGRMGIPCIGVAERMSERVFRGAAVIVDALFGTGLSRPPSGVYAALIERVGRCFRIGMPVVSVDVPSGLDADTGRPVGDDAVRASITVAMGFAKPGMFRPGSRRWFGRVVVADIGHPQGIRAMLVRERGGTDRMTGRIA